MNIGFNQLDYKNTLRYMQSYLAILSLTALTSVVRSDWKELSLCGMRPAIEDSPYRIIGGRNARPGELPWQVYIADNMLPLINWPESRCGGAIIHERWILTAAHCFSDQPIFYPMVMIGSLRTQVRDSFDYDDLFDHSDKTIQAIEVEKIITHEKFVAKWYKNDIALLRLKKPIRFDKFSQPICLPQPGENFLGKVCKTSGWGVINEKTKEKPKWLKVVNLPVIPQAVCNRTHIALGGLENIVFHNNLCTLYPKGGKDACQGDSGGPLSCRRNDGRFVLAGVNSWGDNCGSRNSPGVFARISDFYTWIEEKTGLDFS